MGFGNLLSFGRLISGYLALTWLESLPSPAACSFQEPFWSRQAGLVHHQGSFEG